MAGRRRHGPGRSRWRRWTRGGRCRRSIGNVTIPPVPARLRAGAGARPLTLVVHLLAAPACDGRLVGHVDVVDTGETLPIREAADLVALVQRLALEARG